LWNADALLLSQCQRDSLGDLRRFGIAAAAQEHDGVLGFRNRIRWLVVSGCSPE
jgi:hypothetical protein